MHSWLDRTNPPDFIFSELELDISSKSAGKLSVIPR